MCCLLFNDEFIILGYISEKDIEIHNSINRRRIGLRADYIVNDIPVIISTIFSCRNTEQVHTLLVVGIEVDKNDSIAKNQCLDSDES